MGANKIIALPEVKSTLALIQPVLNHTIAGYARGSYLIEINKILALLEIKSNLAVRAILLKILLQILIKQLVLQIWPHGCSRTCKYGTPFRRYHRRKR